MPMRVQYHRWLQIFAAEAVQNQVWLQSGINHYAVRSPAQPRDVRVLLKWQRHDRNHIAVISRHEDFISIDNSILKPGCRKSGLFRFHVTSIIPVRHSSSEGASEHSA